MVQTLASYHAVCLLRLSNTDLCDMRVMRMSVMGEICSCYSTPHCVAHMSLFYTRQNFYLLGRVSSPRLMYRQLHYHTATPFGHTNLDHPRWYAHQSLYVMLH